MAEVEMAAGSRSPMWPLPDVTRRRWTFGASRSGGRRRHAGVDLYAPRGSVVLSPEDGKIVATQRFNGPQAHAILIELDSGPVILLGEVEPRSWLRHGVSVGDRVSAGQPVADVGINPGGSQMLHVEMYRSGTRRNHRWMAGSPPPPQLLDPTRYLQRAAALDTGVEDDVDDDVDDDVEDVDDVDDVEDDVEPDVVVPPERDRRAAVGPGIMVIMGLVLLDEVIG